MQVKKMDGRITITKRRPVWLFVLFYSVMVNAEVNTSNCSRTDQSVVHCIGESIPISLPTVTQHVILEGVDLNIFRKGQFEHKSWQTVTYLEINAYVGMYIFEGAFMGLNNLHHLKLKCSDLRHLGQFSFSGLSRLEKLDVSDNVYLGLKDVLFVLKESPNTTLPSLQWLNLANLQSVSDTYHLDAETFRILASRPIEYLDFSHAIISHFDLIGFNKLCTHIQHIVLNGATVTEPRIDFKAGLPRTCTPLKILDVRNIYSSVFMGMLRYIRDFDFVKIFLHIFNNVEIVLMGNVFHKEKVGEMSIVNTVFDLTTIPLSFRKIDISRNNIRIFNVTIYLHPRTINSLKETDFSDNLLEYISPRVFHQSVNTENLNLSRNNLNDMSINHHKEFELLVNPLTNLKIFSMSKNDLAAIPNGMFVNNSRLQHINLSGNRLNKIDFKLDHLKYLKMLDISKNQIKVLGDYIFVQFDNLWKLQQDTTFIVDDLRSNMPTVLLDSNPLECTCDGESIRSIEWIEYSGFVRGNRTTIVCSLDDVDIAIFQDAPKKTKEHCHRLLVLKHVTIFGIVLSFIIIVSVIIVVVLRRRLAKKNALKTFIKKVKTGDQLKNLIFLSFCNEDGDYVLEHIYPSMNEEASKTLNCDRNLVCCGELNFRPGVSVCLEAMRCIEDSAVVIFVVSNTFCQKDWCKMEVDTANAQRKPVILLMLEKVRVELMTPYIKNLFNRYTRASWKHDQNGGHPHPPWPVLISSVIELGSSFNVENQTEAERRSEVNELTSNPEMNMI